jgi:hypothetical protein
LGSGELADPLLSLVGITPRSVVASELPGGKAACRRALDSYRVPRPLGSRESGWPRRAHARSAPRIQDSTELRPSASKPSGDIPAHSARRRLADRETPSASHGGPSIRRPGRSDERVEHELEDLLRTGAGGRDLRGPLQGCLPSRHVDEGEASVELLGLRVGAGGDSPVTGHHDLRVRLASAAHSSSEVEEDQIDARPLCCLVAIANWQ